MKDKNVATPLLRILAYLIDAGIICMPIIYIFNLISQSSNVETFLNSVSIFAFFVIYPVLIAVVTALMISQFGGTLGKLLTGTEIVNNKGEKLSFWNAVWRNTFGYMVSSMLLWLGFIWVFIDSERRGWHDLMADSFVVVKSKSAWVLGLVVMLFVFYTEFMWVKDAVTNFKVNSDFYEDFYSEIQNSFEETDESS